MALARIPLNIIRSRRKTLCLQVSKPDIVTVRAPLRCSVARINQFVQQHQQWIDKQLAHQRANPGLPEQTYQPGSLIWLLGKRYPICFEYASQRSIELQDEAIIIRGKENDKEGLARYLERWLRTYAADLLSARTQRIHASASVDLPPCQTSIRKMKRQWGNCSRKGEIKYNLALIHYPVECIDYVICHELSHLLYFNHSRDFYDLMQQLCPDWRRLKHQLETFSP